MDEIILYLMWRRGVSWIGGIGVLGAGAYSYTNVPVPSIWDSSQGPEIHKIQSNREMKDLILAHGKVIGYLPPTPQQFETTFRELEEQSLFPHQIYQRKNWTNSDEENLQPTRFAYILSTVMINHHPQFSGRLARGIIPSNMLFGGLKGVSLMKTAILDYYLILFLPQNLIPVTLMILGETWSYYKLSRYIQHEEQGQHEKVFDQLLGDFIFKSTTEAFRYVDCYGCLIECRQQMEQHYDNRITTQLEGRIQYNRRQRCLCHKHDTIKERLFGLPHPFFIDSQLW